MVTISPRDVALLEAGRLRARKPRPRAERDVQAAILELLRAIPWIRADRHNTGAARYPRKDGGDRLVRFSPVGTPDITGWVVVLQGRRALALAFAVEVKRAGGIVRPEQAAYLQQLDRDGGVAIVATSIDDVVQALRGLGLWRGEGRQPTLDGMRAPAFTGAREG